MSKTSLSQLVKQIVIEQLARAQVRALLEAVEITDPAVVANKMKDLYNQIWDTDVFTVEQDGRSFTVKGPRAVPVNGKTPDIGNSSSFGSRDPSKQGQEYLDDNTQIVKLNKNKVMQTLKSMLPSTMKMKIGGADSIVFYGENTRVVWNWYMVSSNEIWGFVEANKNGSLADSPAPASVIKV